MDKSCSILISNQNSYEAIQLCIESIRYYTKYPDYNIIVYDDCSNNEIDLPYLREKQEQGWLSLIEGVYHKNHGGALNILINEICQTDLAMILDCDIQILRSGWLIEMIRLISQDKKAIAVCNCMGIKHRGEHHRGSIFVGPFCEFWFGLLNMTAYRDDMQVDWTPKIIDNKDEMKKYAEDLDVNKIDKFVLDVGSKLFVKVKYDNPKEYYIISPMPEDINGTFKHYMQVTCHLDARGPSAERIKEYARQKLNIIKTELETLRQQKEV